MRTPARADLRRSLLLLPSLLVMGAGAVAGTVPPNWTHDFADPIRWQRSTALGPLLVSTTSALEALDPASGTALWSARGLSDLPVEGITELPGSPLMLMTDGNGNRRTVIVNVLNGNVIFDSRAAGLGQISAPRLLPRAGSLLIAGFEPERTEPMLFAYAIDDGRQLWKSDVLSQAMNPRGGALLGLLMSAALAVANVDPLQSAPIELDDGSFVLGAMGHVMRIDSATGQTRWKTAFAGGRFEMRVPDARPGNIYVGAEETSDAMGGGATMQQTTQTQYQGFRLDDGSVLWRKPFRFGKPMNPEIIALDQGLVVSDGDKDKGKLLLLDYDTGESLWGNKGKGLPIAGLVLDHFPAGNDLVLTTGYDSIWSNKDTEYLLYVLDPATGALRFEDPFKTRGRMLGTELTRQGVIYVTTQEINVFDPATGTLSGAEGLRSRKPLVTTSDGRLVYAFNGDDGHLYRFDRENGTTVQLSPSPFEFEEKDSARALELLGGTLVLTGQQTVAGFGTDGQLQFHTHHPAPRDPAWIRALAWAEGVRAGMASVSAGLYSAAFADVAGQTDDGTLEHELAAGLEQGFSDLQQGYQGLAADYVRFARQRYQASAESRDFVFMLLQQEDRRIVLAQISKRDGSIEAEIDLDRDREPAYQVDDIGRAVFYQPSATTIAGYRF